MKINELKNRFLFLNEFNLLFLLLGSLLIIGFFGQYSAFNGEFNDFVQKHLLRIAGGLMFMCCVYVINFKIWNNYAYIFYALSFCSLIVVEMLGITKLGAQRWVNLYFFSLQPSELMKISLVLSLSRYYSLLSPLELKDLKKHILPIIFILMPVILILKQPDLGTAAILFCVGFGIIFLSGFPLKVYALTILSGIILCPLSWFFLHDYQKNRILTFLDPDRDPFGSGYHVLQSKIAIGSGNIFGRGFLGGSQSKLNFLPEKNTDFIFTTIAEESGFVGATIIVLLFLMLTFYFFWVGSMVKNQFSKYMCCGFGILLFLHAFVNIAMVVGIVPVVGIPLPFLSYGGSSMITFMVSCGMIMSALAYKKSCV